MVSVGFTGSRSGPTPAQISQIEGYLAGTRKPLEVHHGDCVGCDEWFHAIVALHYPRDRIWVHVHPPDNPKYRAYCDRKGVIPKGRLVIYPEAPYLDRNRDIVAAADELIACPSSTHELRRSGTWATVRAAQKKGIPIYVFYPDGKVGLR